MGIFLRVLLRVLPLLGIAPACVTSKAQQARDEFVGERPKPTWLVNSPKGAVIGRSNCFSTDLSNAPVDTHFGFIELKVETVGLPEVEHHVLAQTCSGEGNVTGLRMNHIFDPEQGWIEKCEIDGEVGIRIYLKVNADDIHCSGDSR